MHAQDEMPERIAIRFHVQGAGCQLDPFGRGHFWYAEPVTGRLEFVIRHVEQITQLRVLQLRNKPAVEFLIDVRRYQLPADLPSTDSQDTIRQAGVGVPIGHIR